MPSNNGLPQVFAIVVAAGLGSSACSDQCCSPFSPVYYAVAYGRVTQDGVPMTGIEMGAAVFTASCSLPGVPGGQAQTRTGAGGAYRVLLSSTSQAEGQCLQLSVSGTTEPVLRTLTGMPFSAEAPTQVRDSIQIDLELP